MRIPVIGVLGGQVWHKPGNTSKRLMSSNLQQSFSLIRHKEISQFSQCSALVCKSRPLWCATETIQYQALRLSQVAKEKKGSGHLPIIIPHLQYVLVEGLKPLSYRSPWRPRKGSVEWDGGLEAVEWWGQPLAAHSMVINDHPTGLKSGPGGKTDTSLTLLAQTSQRKENMSNRRV